MVDYNDTKALDDELATVMRSQAEHKSNMVQSRNFYDNSAFYESRSGDSRNKSFLQANMLKVFADKNIQYTSRILDFKVPTPSASDDERKKASIREKIIYGTHQLSNSALQQSDRAFDLPLSTSASPGN